MTPLSLSSSPQPFQPRTFLAPTSQQSPEVNGSQSFKRTLTFYYSPGSNRKNTNLGVSQFIFQSLKPFIKSTDTVSTYQGFTTLNGIKIYKMPDYSQFSINVSFPTPPPQYLLLLSSFSYPVFFLNQESTLYTLSQRRSAKIKWKLKQIAKLFWLSQTLLLMMWSKTLRLKQQMVLFETNLILWLCLVEETYLPNLNYC